MTDVPKLPPFDWAKHYDKPVICEIAIRPEYDGRPAKPGMLKHNGVRLPLVALWRMDTDDKYPDEWALSTPHSVRILHELIGVSWISSGDVVPAPESKDE